MREQKNLNIDEARKLKENKLSFKDAVERYY